MQKTPFHAYYTATTLSNYSDSLLPAYSSTNIAIFPYQIAAAQFALRASYQKGCILCDEGSLGKTYEALLIATQKWYEGYTKQLVILPLNLIQQWIDKIEEGFGFPYLLIDNKDTYDEIKKETVNPFNQDSVIITSYDFAVEKASDIQQIHWNLAIFDEASYLCKIYTKQNKKATILKEITENAFKLLLTPTPITLSIMIFMD